MIAHKRSVLAQVLSGRDLQRASRVVRVDRQEKNKGSAGSGKSVASLKRTEPVESLKRTEPLYLDGLQEFESDSANAVALSSDYFRKVPPRRKDWARSLGLWADGTGLTTRGRGLTKALRAAGYIQEEGFFTFWPMDYELIRAGFRPDLFTPTGSSLWETALRFAEGYGGVGCDPFSDDDPDTLVDMLARMMAIYRSLHARKSMLRREIAITVAYPAMIAIAIARGEPVLDVPQALNAEQKADKRRVAFRRSRNTGGALSVRR
jgi:hypothetical protein